MYVYGVRKYTFCNSKCETVDSNYGGMTDMQTETARTGITGEALAKAYLEGIGYQIVECNTRLGRYEIDIVAKDISRSMLVFVEVKTRSVYDAAYPIRTAVDARKRRALRRAVARWVNRNQYEGAGRIDVISVANGKVIEHLMDLGAEFF